MAIHFYLPAVANSIVHSIVFAIYLWNWTSSFSHGVHPAYVHGLLSVSSAVSWLPSLAINETCAAEQIVRFVCLRLNAVHELYKFWILNKDLQDAEDRHYATTLLFLSSLYLLLALLATVFVLTKQTVLQFLGFWEAADAGITVVYVIIACQYWDSRRKKHLEAPVVLQIVLFCVISTLRHTSGFWNQPVDTEPGTLSDQTTCKFQAQYQVQVGLSLLQVILLNIFGEPVWMSWIRERVSGITPADMDASASLLRD
ncbi:hypothetical protein XANCAGTX0491_009995 [Xanthoria calcicola]